MSRAHPPVTHLPRREQPQLAALLLAPSRVEVGHRRQPPPVQRGVVHVLSEACAAALEACEEEERYSTLMQSEFIMYMCEREERKLQRLACGMQSTRLTKGAAMPWGHARTGVCSM